MSDNRDHIYKINNNHINLFHLTVVGPLDYDHFYLFFGGEDGKLEVSFGNQDAAIAGHSDLLVAWRKCYPQRTKSTNADS